MQTYGYKWSKVEYYGVKWGVVQLHVYLVIDRLIVIDQELIVIFIGT